MVAFEFLADRTPIPWTHAAAAPAGSYIKGIRDIPPAKTTRFAEAHAGFVVGLHPGEMLHVQLAGGTTCLSVSLPLFPSLFVFAWVSFCLLFLCATLCGYVCVCVSVRLCVSVLSACVTYVIQKVKGAVWL